MMGGSFFAFLMTCLNLVIIQRSRPTILRAHKQQLPHIVYNGSVGGNELIGQAIILLLNNSSMTLQMASSKAHSKPHPVCSIEELHNQSPLEELLLASDSKHEPIQQQDQDQLFDFYITPYTERDPKENPFKHDRQQDTVLRFSKKEQGSTQLYRRADEQLEINRLKSIIQKKNVVIGQLTEEITALNQQLSKATARKSKKGDKGKLVGGKRDNNQWEFLQKNNSELFQSLRQCQAQKEELCSQLMKLKGKIIPQLELQITLLLAQNKQLHQQNTALMKDIKSYIANSKKEIKYVNKMRDILAHKAIQQDSTLDLTLLGPSNSKQLQERSIRSQQKLTRNQSRSVRQESTRRRDSSFVRGSGERCYSIDKLHRLLI